MRKKGFTLIELLVVIAIIAMLLAILMPALGKVKRLAERLVCGTNIRGLVTAVKVYSNDYDDEYPIQGGRGDHTLAYMTTDWDSLTKDWSTDGDITIAASLFLLVREADVGAKSFVCKGGDEKVFEGENSNNLEFTELWDFGGDPVDDYGQPKDYVSYAYHRQYPNDAGTYSSFPISGSDSAGRAILADKSPFFDPGLTWVSGATSASPSATSENWTTSVSQIAWDDETTGWTKWWVQVGNSNAHGREGQNVGYGDGHVYFEKRPDVGVQNDNIYTPFLGDPPKDFLADDKRRGAKGSINGYAKTTEDSLLINDDDPTP